MASDTASKLYKFIVNNLSDQAEVDLVGFNGGVLMVQLQ